MSVVEYSELDSQEGKRWNECGILYDEGYIKLGAVKAVVPRSFLNYYKLIKSFHIWDDDVWVVCFPKTGTTWTQEMAWCIMNDLDFEAAKVDLDTRSPFFELRANWSPKLAQTVRRTVLGENAPPGPEDPFATDPAFPTSFEKVESMKRPRLIKTHLHLSLLPQQLIEGSTKAKMIYVARNPKDTCISFFHHSVLFNGYTGSLEDFVEAFITDNVYCAPYWSHLREFWDIRESRRNDILFLKYEDMKEDLPSVVHQTASFLGKTLTDEQVSVLVDHLSFESMKTNPAVCKERLIKSLCRMHGQDVGERKFFRKGRVGSWTEEQVPGHLLEQFDEWMGRNEIPGLY